MGVDFQNVTVCHFLRINIIEFFCMSTYLKVRKSKSLCHEKSSKSF